MSVWFAAAAALLLFLVLGLWFYGRGFVRRVEQRFPPLGRLVRVAPLNLHVIERGPPDAPVLVCLHGATANAREFLTLAPLLEDDHRLLMLDRPGYGYSQRPPRAHRIGVQAALIARAIEAEAPGGALLIAHSLGGGVALRIALDRPDLVRGLVLVAPASHPYPGQNPWWARLAARPLIGPLFAATLVPLVAPSASRSAIRNTFWPAQATATYVHDAGVPLAFRPRAFRASARDVVASKREFQLQAPRYGEIAQPAIVITADKDRVVSPKLHAQALARDLQAAELVTLPGAGHMPHQLRPEALAAAVRRIEEILAARGE